MSTRRVVLTRSAALLGAASTSLLLPLRLTAPVYVCAPVVVTLAPRFVVPDTLRLDSPV